MEDAAIPGKAGLQTMLLHAVGAGPGGPAAVMDELHMLGGTMWAVLEAAGQRERGAVWQFQAAPRAAGHAAGQ